MTVSGTTISTYLDGALANSGTYSGGVLTFTTLKLGFNRTENLPPYDGILDEVHIWGRALSAAEVMAVYGSGIMGLCH